MLSSRESGEKNWRKYKKFRDLAYKDQRYGLLAVRTSRVEVVYCSLFLFLNTGERAINLEMPCKEEIHVSCERDLAAE